MSCCYKEKFVDGSITTTVLRRESGLTPLTISTFGVRAYSGYNVRQEWTTVSAFVGKYCHCKFTTIMLQLYASEKIVYVCKIGHTAYLFDFVFCVLSGIPIWEAFKIYACSTFNESYTSYLIYHCKYKFVVLTTEWLPWSQTNSGYESTVKTLITSLKVSFCNFELGSCLLSCLMQVVFHT